jgi:predicted DNA-binding protein
MDSNILAVEREVLKWPSVTSEPGRFGAVAFRYGKREIGHIHRDRIADLPVTTEMRENILSKGRARPHRAGVKGYISYPLEDQEDLSVVLEILGRNYDRAKAAAERRAASQEEAE